METKELKTKVPDGYEIDKENSTFECIKFKPIKKYLTYEDVAKELFKGDKEFFAIDEYFILPANSNNRSIDANLNCTSQKQAKKLIAINKLLNVAKYLNGDWRPNWNDTDEEKYYIYLYDHYGDIGVLYDNNYFNYSLVYFNNRTLAQKAINILGEEAIKTALSTDW